MWKKSAFLIFLPFVFVFGSCATVDNKTAAGQTKQARTQAEEGMNVKTLNFSGYDWVIKESAAPVGPGPNVFSGAKDSVWVDAAGKLHLTIRQRNGKWECSEVYNTKSLGYGRYVFYVSANFPRLDVNAIFGLFTWDNAEEYNHREIDVEISRWGLVSNRNTQFVVQPFTKDSNVYRFDHMTNDNQAAYVIEWQKGEVYFAAYEGQYTDDSHKVRDWLFRGPDVPPPGNEKCDINFWLLDGNSPIDGVNVEVVVDKFEFSAL